MGDARLSSFESHHLSVRARRPNRPPAGPHRSRRACPEWIPSVHPERRGIPIARGPSSCSDPADLCHPVFGSSRFRSVSFWSSRSSLEMILHIRVPLQGSWGEVLVFVGPESRPGTSRDRSTASPGSSKLSGLRSGSVHRPILGSSGAFALLAIARVRLKRNGERPPKGALTDLKKETPGELQKIPGTFATAQCQSQSATTRVVLWPLSRESVKFAEPRGGATV